MYPVSFSHEINAASILLLHMVDARSGFRREPVAPSIDADHSGILFKRGHMNKKFKMRFFVLCGTRVSYFESRDAAGKGRAPNGRVTVCKVRHLRPEEGNAMEEDGLTRARLPFAFHFETLEKKPFVCFAESMQEKLSWMRALLLATNSPTAAFATSAGSVNTSSHRTSSGGSHRFEGIGSGGSSPPSSPRSYGVGSSSHAPVTGTPFELGGDFGGVTSACVEDLYREHVSAVLVGGDALESLDCINAWRTISEGLNSLAMGAAQAAEMVAFDPLAAAEFSARAAQAAQQSFDSALQSCAQEGDSSLSSSSPQCFASSSRTSMPTFAAHYESGKLHCTRQEYGHALSHFESAIGAAPPEAMLTLRLQCAWCQWHLGRYRQAEATYLELLENAPLSRHCLADRARMLLDLSNRMGDGRGSSSPLSGHGNGEGGSFTTGGAGLTARDASASSGSCKVAAKPSARWADAMNDIELLLEMEGIPSVLPLGILGTQQRSPQPSPRHSPLSSPQPSPQRSSPLRSPPRRSPLQSPIDAVRELDSLQLPAAAVPRDIRHVLPVALPDTPLASMPTGEVTVDAPGGRGGERFFTGGRATAELLNDRGVCLLALGETHAAFDALTDCLAIEPELLPAHANLKVAHRHVEVMQTKLHPGSTSTRHLDLAPNIS